MRRRLPILFAFAAALAAAQQGGQPSRIEGQVTSSAGGPIRKAAVALRTASTQGGRSFNSADTTDEQGRFLFEELPAGVYSITVERQGFLTQAYGARPGSNTLSNAGATITLGNGEEKKGVNITLTPQSVITGRITDQDGDPITTTVVAMRVNYVRGRRTMTPATMATSDDQGNYRLPRLSSGRYYVGAGDARGITQAGSTWRPGRNTARIANVVTYYPGVAESTAAAPVQIAPGADVQGIDIRLRRSNIFDIRGTVIAAGSDPSKVKLTLMPKELNIFTQTQVQTQIQANGTFELRNVPPGAYRLDASTNVPRPGNTNPAAPARMIAAQLDVMIGDSNLEGVTLELRPAGDVAGSIRFEPGDGGTDPQVAGPQIAGPQINVQPPAIVPTNGAPVAPTPGLRPWNVTLAYIEGLTLGAAAPAARATDDGRFQLTNVQPGKYVVNVNPMPQGSYIKSIRLGGQDVTYKPIDFSSGASGTIEIVVSGNAASVTGVVRNSKGDAIPYATVTIWPKDRTARPLGTGITTNDADQSGNFRFGALAPGEYLVAAWEEVETGFTQSPDFLVRFDREATSVTLREGSRESVEAKLVPRDAILVAVSAIQ